MEKNRLNWEKEESSASKKTGDFVWSLLRAVSIISAALSALFSNTFLLWPTKKPGERVKSNVGWILYPHLFERTFGNKVYVVIIMIAILILGLVIFFANK